MLVESGNRWLVDKGDHDSAPDVLGLQHGLDKTDDQGFIQPEPGLVDHLD